MRKLICKYVAAACWHFSKVAKNDEYGWALTTLSITFVFNIDILLRMFGFSSLFKANGFCDPLIVVGAVTLAVLALLYFLCPKALVKDEMDTFTKWQRIWGRVIFLVHFLGSTFIFGLMFLKQH